VQGPSVMRKIKNGKLSLSRGCGYPTIATKLP
jgi:hypothetical protein